MKDLNYISVPEAIKRIEYYDDLAELKSFDGMYREPTNVKEFVEKSTNMIHFEEAAATKSLHTYYLSTLKLTLICNKAQTFRIDCVEDLSKWIKAFNDKK